MRNTAARHDDSDDDPPRPRVFTRTWSALLWESQSWGILGRCSVPRAHRNRPRYTAEVVSAAAKEILEAAMKLEPTEREHLAHELLESIDASSDGEISPQWEAEIQRRLRKIESGEATFVSGDEVFARAEAILRGGR
jgi:putative addiction module component (TIGR02574 family)